jgi:hypothetical protein
MPRAVAGSTADPFDQGACSMRTHVRGLVAFALLVAGTALTTASGGNLSFLDKSPVSYFTPEDFDMMHQNSTQVLDAQGASAKQAWSNAKTGASGWAQVRGQFTASDGVPCKRLRVVNKARGLESDSTFTVCKYADRGWVLNPDAAPAR